MEEEEEKEEDEVYSKLTQRTWVGG